MSTLSLSPEQQSALSAGRHFVVRANAGSGKTFLLTMRIVWLLIHENVAPEHIVAITFTTKAAAEMKQRVRHLIDRFLDSAEDRSTVLGTSGSDAEIISKLTAIRNSIGKLRISTFHAFATGILRNYGAAIRLDPNSGELSDRKRRDLLLQITAQTLQLYPAQHTELCFDYLGMKGTHELVYTLAGNGELLQSINSYRSKTANLADTRLERASTIASEILKPLVDTVYKTLKNSECANDPKCKPLLESLGNALQVLLSAPTSFDGIASAIKALKEFYTDSGTPRKKKVFTDYLPDIQSALKSVFALAKVNPAAERTQAEVLTVLANIATEAHTRFSAEKRRASVMDFDDMMLCTMQLFETHPEICSMVRSSVKHLFIDEFQDTNPLQYKIVTKLVPNLISGNEHLSSPELFVVGDDKQSIYGFRDADVRLFKEVEHAAERVNRVKAPSLPTQAITLQSSYRITPSLADAINNVCRLVFPGDTEFDVPYSNLISQRPQHNTTLVGTLRVITVPPNTKDGSADASDLESPAVTQASVAESVVQETDELDIVVRYVLSILNGSADISVISNRGSGIEQLTAPQAGHIAILVRKRNEVSELARRLQANGVPVLVHGGRAFFSRPEVADIRNLLRALTDTDPIALAAVLRSPLFRCTDADLLFVRSVGNGAPFSHDAFLTSAQHPHAPESLVRARDILALLKQLLPTTPPDAIVLQALMETQWHKQIGNHPRRNQIIHNVDKLIDLIRIEQQAPGASLLTVISSIQVPDETDNEAERVPPVTDAVQIMTLHASKGMEFPIVLLCGISSAGRSDSVRTSDQLSLTVNLPSNRGAEHWSCPDALGDSASHVVNGIIAQERIRAEEKRLLYVALTRAMDHAAVVVNPEGGSGSRMLSLLAETGAIKHFTPYTVTATPGTVHVTASSPSLLPLHEPIRTSGMPATVHVSSLASANFLGGPASPSGSMDTGTEFHQRIALLLTNQYQPSGTEPAEWSRFLDVRDVWQPPGAIAQVEQERVGMLGATLVIGRPDVIFRISPTHAEIWDWKLISPTSDEEYKHYSAMYYHQLLAYAWLLLKPETELETVDAYLAFVPNAGPDRSTWTSKWTFRRDHLQELERELTDAIASAAATADAHAH